MCLPFFCFVLFSIRVFFHRHWRFTGQQGKGGDQLLFHSTTSARSRTFKHLFATLHVRWLSRILIAPLVFTRLLLNEISHLIELQFDWLTDWLMIQCLFIYLMNWFKVFVTAIWHGKPVDLNSHRLSPLYYKRITKIPVTFKQEL